MYYIGLDIHKEVIASCVKVLDGSMIDQGTIVTDRQSLGVWVKGLPKPWVGAMEATRFTGWVYDFLKPHAVSLKVAHPAILRATVARKKKELLHLSCSSCEMFRFFHKRLVAELRTNPLIRDRMRRLMPIPGFKKYGKCPWFYWFYLTSTDSVFSLFP